MADVIQRIIDGQPIRNGNSVVKAGKPTAGRFRQYQNAVDDGIAEETGSILPPEPNLTDLETKLTGRMDDPTFYTA